MLRFIIRRVLLLIPVFIGLSMVVFIIGRILPGDPVQLAAGPHATKEEIAALAHEFGLGLQRGQEDPQRREEAVDDDQGRGGQAQPGCLEPRRGQCGGSTHRSVPMRRR